MLKTFVGAAKVCIDPTGDMFPMPTRFGQCDAIYDSCYCRAVALGNGEKTMLLITYDLSDQPRVEGLTGEIAKATGVPKDDIVIIVTHNHSSPCDAGFGGDTEEQKLRREQFKHIELEAGVQAARDAVQNMQPARYGYGECPSYINVNRDYQTPFGHWAEERNEAGYSDKTLAMIKFEDMNGNMIAAILNHGTHATCAFLMKDFDGKAKLTGNFPGIACRFAEEHFGGGAVVMWTSGAAGNQNPILSHGLLYLYPDGYDTAVHYPDGVGYMQMEYIGRRHGADAVKGLRSIQANNEQLPLEHLSEVLWLPAQRRQDNLLRNANLTDAGNVAHVGLRIDFDTPVKDPVYPEMVDDPEHPRKMQMQLVMLGDIAIVCVGAELYAELGRDLKQTSPFAHTFVMTHTADDEHIGYIVDRSNMHNKVFQAFGRNKPGASDDIILACWSRLTKQAETLAAQQLDEA